MMSATTDVVLENTAYNVQLLAAIAELDYVPPALEQQESYLAGLEKEWAQLTDEITFLEEQTKKERKEHEALRDSTTRRFAAKITGKKEKFEAKASKEEK
jgi:septal ring factor EnvC (AmiA/AmiB activator)